MAVGFTSASVTASAGVVEFDLTDSATASGADAQQIYTLPVNGGITVTLTSILASTIFNTPPSLGNAMTFNGSASEALGCSSSGTTLACDGDGIGIWGGQNNDEIDQQASSDELLLIGVSSVDPMLLLSIEFLDLFENEGVVGGVNIAGVFTPYSLAGSNATVGGYGFLDLQTAFPNPISDDVVFAFRSTVVHSDYSVARLRFQVPEPMTWLMLAMALPGLCMARQRGYRLGFQTPK